MDAKKINYHQFIAQIEKAQEIIDKIKSIEKQNWENKDKAQWKQIVNNAHDFYNKKFINDIKLCRIIQPFLKILTNTKIQARHW